MAVGANDCLGSAFVIVGKRLLLLCLEGNSVWGSAPFGRLFSIGTRCSQSSAQLNVVLEGASSQTTILVGHDGKRRNAMEAQLQQQMDTLPPELGAFGGGHFDTACFQKPDSCCALLYFAEEARAVKIPGDQSVLFGRPTAERPSPSVWLPTTPPGGTRTKRRQLRYT